MSLQVVDADQGNASRERERLPRGEPDEQRSDQPRSGRRRDETDVRETDPRLPDRFFEDRRQVLQVGPRRDLRDDAAISGVRLHLRRDDVGQDPARAVHHGDRSLVARRLDAENERRFVICDL